MKRWLSIAARRDVVISSLKICVVVGTVLVSINYFDRLFSGNLSGIDYFKALLMYCVPYCVSTYGSVSVSVKDGS